VAVVVEVRFEPGEYFGREARNPEKCTSTKRGSKMKVTFSPGLIIAVELETQGHVDDHRIDPDKIVLNDDCCGGLEANGLIKYYKKVEFRPE